MRRAFDDAALIAKTLIASAGAGMLWDLRPWHLLPALRAYRASGASLATLVAIAAVRAPDTDAVIDERGRLTYRQLDRRAAAIAAGLHARNGIGAGSTVGVLCRNHRGFIEALVAAARLGANVVLLNTEFSTPQLAQVFASSRPDLVVLDEEFVGLVDSIPAVLAWRDGGETDVPTLDELAVSTHPTPPAPREPGRITILTSGTTGTPKGASRAPSVMDSVGPLATILTRARLRAGDPVLIAPPLFHGFGLAVFGLAAFLRSPMVLIRRFDAAEALRSIERHRVRCLVAVPVMLQRMLAVRDAGVDLSILRCVLSGAAPLPPTLATRLLDEWGDVLFNGYGSSEIGIASLATPADLRQAPGTVGKPALGVPVAVLDDSGSRVADGRIGTVHVGGRLVFAGYTGGGSKDVVNGMMSTGDRGHFDETGRLYIDGRADDMIVSGGENVYPQEVENVLARQAGVADVAVIGVADEEFGQRLVAYLVAASDVRPSNEDLKRHVRANLARYKVPRQFVFLDELPRNPAGKLVRRKLPAPPAV
ncbi:MAG: AMP-binding protein [Haloechinothrix sp.]